MAAQIRLQFRRGGGRGFNLRRNLGPSRLDGVLDHLLNQLLLGGEVIGDHALADACPPGNVRQRGLGIAQRRNRLDSTLDELDSPGCFSERQMGSSTWFVFRTHKQSIVQLAERSQPPMSDACGERG